VRRDEAVKDFVERKQRVKEVRPRWLHQPQLTTQLEQLLQQCTLLQAICNACQWVGGGSCRMACVAACVEYV
jgi:hypothetical protein